MSVETFHFDILYLYRVPINVLDQPQVLLSFYEQYFRRNSFKGIR